MNHLQGAIKIANNNFNPFIEWWSYHPPLVYELVAFTYQLAGSWKIAARFVILIFSLLTVIYTYLLGKRLYDRYVGFVAAILLVFSPIFIIQSSLFHLAIPLAAMTIMTYYYYFTYQQANKVFLPYLTTASLLVLVKEPAVLVILSLVIYELFQNRNNLFRRDTITRLFILAFPVFVFVVWLVGNKLTFNWFFWPYNLSYFTTNPPHQTLELSTILTSFFWHDFKLLTSLLIFMTAIISLFNQKARNMLFKKEMLSFFILIVLAIAFFYWGPFLSRYALFTYPAFFIIGAASLVYLLQNKPFLLIIILVISGALTSCWKSIPTSRVNPANYHYIVRINLHKQMAEYLEQNWSDYKILTFWPMWEELKFPEMGYVEKDLMVYFLNEDMIKTKGEAVILINETYLQTLNFDKKLKLLLKTGDIELVKQLYGEWDGLLLYYVRNIERISPYLPTEGIP